MSGSRPCSPGCSCKKHSPTLERNAKISAAEIGKKPTGEPADGFFYCKDGYRYLTGQYGHPLAIGNGQLAEHRKVLYEKIGPGPHVCYWCGVMLEWGGLDGINIDHLDEDKANNDPENLEPSCCSCNRDRHRRKAIA